MKKKIYLCRHAETIWNIPEKQHLQGWSDSDLSEKGRNQTLLLKDFLLRSNILKIYTSPLLRCIRTLKPFLETRNVACETLDQLKEINYGLYDGLPSHEARLKYRDFFTVYDNSQDPQSNTIQFPKGESRFDAAKRLLEVLKHIVTQDGTCFIMTHGGVLSSLFLLLFNKKREFNNCEVIELWYDNLQKKFIIEGDK